MFEGWTEAEIREHGEGMALTDRIASLRESGQSWPAVAAALGIGVATAQRWHNRRAMLAAGYDRALLCGKSTGRKPLYVPSAEELVLLKKTYLKTNLADGTGSKSLAARIVANSDHVSDELRHAVLKPRASKHTLTKTIRDAMHISPDLIRHHRQPKENRLGGVFAPGSLRIATDGTRRLRAGERFSFDDGSVNFVMCVPWPWGGDRCSDKYGVRVGRFQLLVGHDDASSFVPGFTFTMRPRESYRAADATAAMFRLCRDAGKPDEIVAEGGAWQAHRSMDFFRASGVNMIDASGRPHKKLIENWFNRAWTAMSLIDGQIGRYRAEMERENNLLTRCQAGREDPRNHFPMLTSGIAAITGTIDYCNHDTVESKTYGKWIPSQRWEEDHAECPRQGLAQSLGWLAAPEMHTVTVRNHCMVVCRVLSPLGDSMPYHFADPTLREFAGCKVRVYFDPFDDPVTATVVLAEDAHGVKAGTHVAVRVPLLDEVPSIVQGADGWELSDGAGTAARALAIRKQTAQILRTEYRDLIGKKRETTVRDHRSASTVAAPLRQTAPAPVAPAAPRAEPAFARGGTDASESDPHNRLSTIAAPGARRLPTIRNWEEVTR
jgi:hypothetical protein